MRKAQVNQAFTYIAMIIVIGLIVVFGAKALLSLMDQNCRNNRAIFIRDLTGYIDDYSDMGSSRVESLAAPCNAKQVCLVDAGALGNTLGAEPVIEASVQSGLNNIFLNSTFMEPIGLSKKIKLDPSAGQIQCFDLSKGYLRLRFEGEGKTTLITLAPPG